MADRSPARQQIQVHPQQFSRDDAGEYQSSKSGPSASQILAVVALLPIGGTLLALAGITFIVSLIGLVVTTPLFVICSPVIVPAVATIGFAVTGFLSSGAFGLTGLSSLSWLLNLFRQTTEFVPEQMEQAKRRSQELTAYAGQKTKDVAHTIQSKGQETGKEGGRT